MSLTRVRASGMWGLLSAVTPTEFDKLDDNAARGIDGTGGGTYAPTSQIVIGGSGLRITGSFLAEGTARCKAGLTIDTSGNFACSVPGAFSAGLSVQTAGNFVCSRPSSFSGSLGLTGATLVSAGGALTIDTTGTFACNGPGSFSNGLAVNGDLQLVGAGKIAWRYELLGDVNATRGVDTVDEIRLPQATTALRVLTISNTNAVAGSRLHVSRDYSTTTASSNSTTAGFLLKANGTGIQILIGGGSSERNWIDLTFDGSNWFVAAEDKNP